MQKQTVELDFLGHKIPVKTEGDPTLVQEIVDLASLKLSDAKRRTPNASPHQIAVLALLDMTEEYVKARARAAEHRSKLTTQAESLVTKLEAELA